MIIGQKRSFSKNHLYRATRAQRQNRGPIACARNARRVAAKIAKKSPAREELKGKAVWLADELAEVILQMPMEDYGLACFVVMSILEPAMIGRCECSGGDDLSLH